MELAMSKTPNGHWMWAEAQPGHWVCAVEDGETLHVWEMPYGWEWATEGRNGETYETGGAYLSWDEATMAAAKRWKEWTER